MFQRFANAAIFGDRVRIILTIYYFVVQMIKIIYLNAMLLTRLIMRYFFGIACRFKCTGPLSFASIASTVVACFFAIQLHSENLSGGVHMLGIGH